MVREAENIYYEMNKKLDGLNVEFVHLLQQCERAIDVIKEALSELKDIAKKYSFETEVEQISFYKDTSPYFYAKYVYYVAIYNSEAARPIGHKSIQKYYRKEFSKMQHFFYGISDFYKYYRTGNTYLDNLYFTKEQQGHFSVLTYDPAIDTELFTLHSLRLATLLANEQLHTYFINAITEAKAEGTQSVLIKDKLEWTDSKTGLTELIYAWKERGSFNKGRASIQQITDYLEKAFNVKLGNTSRTYQQTLFRKSGPTTYLDELRNDAIKRADRL